MNCGRTHLLEPMVAGETPALEVELRQHAAHCSRCRHELSWLETERRVFRQRASRDEVAALWKGVALAPRRKTVSLRRFAFAAAAVLLVVLGAGQFAFRAASGGGLDASVGAPGEAWSSWESWGESSPLMTEDTRGEEACSKLQPGSGFRCGPVESASFLASR